MNRFFSYLFFSVMLLASSCHKCYQCKQYCAYCISTTNSGLVHKICSGNDANYLKVDSVKSAYQSNGYDCSLLKNDKRVCDGKSKIKDAVDYYLLEDYYCYPSE